MRSAPTLDAELCKKKIGGRYSLALRLSELLKATGADPQLTQPDLTNPTIGLACQSGEAMDLVEAEPPPTGATRRF